MRTLLSGFILATFAGLAVTASYWFDGAVGPPRSWSQDDETWRQEVERRLAELEALHGIGPQPPDAEWSTPPPLRLTIAERDGDVWSWEGAAGEWTVEGPWRWARTAVHLGDEGALFVWTAQAKGVDATSTAWGLVNGLADTGAWEFERLVVELAGELVYELEGAHAVQVRGCLARRHLSGPDAASLGAWEHAPLETGYPAWVPELCEKGLQLAQAQAQEVGPYLLADPGVRGWSSLDGSHGGWKVGPYWMGAWGWQRAAREGWVWATEELHRQLDRMPLVLLDDELEPTNPHVPYWPGRTRTHEPPGWKADPGDGWCEYLPALVTFRPHSYSHGHRNAAAPAMLAPLDPMARDVLRWIWADYAAWLDGARSSNNLLKPWYQVLEDMLAGQGWSNAGRGLAHAVRCFLWVEPYLEADEAAVWRANLRELLGHLAQPNGILYSIAIDPKWGFGPATRSREVDLMYPNLIPLGLGGIASACRVTMAPTETDHAPDAFTATASHWSRGQSAGPNHFPPYDLIRSQSLELLQLEAPWNSPIEQLLDLVPPELLN